MTNMLVAPLHIGNTAVTFAAFTAALSLPAVSRGFDVYGVRSSSRVRSAVIGMGPLSSSVSCLRWLGHRHSAEIPGH
jgi:hypothetical protein